MDTYRPMPPFLLILCLSSLTLGETTTDLLGGQQTTSLSPGAPTIKKEITSQFQKMASENVKFKCSVDGSPRPDITWWKDNVQLHTTSNIEVQRARLTITDLVEEDSGNYSCYATNGYGELRIYFLLEVIPDDPEPSGSSSSDLLDVRSETEATVEDSEPMAPVFSRDTKFRYKPDILVVAGDRVKLKCPYKGYPPPTVVWLKDNMLNWESASNVVDRVSIDDDRLIIDRIMPSVDPAIYKCVVSNSYGTIERSTRVDVIERTASRPIISEINDQEVTVGNNVTFECKVVSDATPHIVWMKMETSGNYSELLASKNRLELINLQSPQSQTLMIYNVTYEDAGYYSCLAGNYLGITRQSAILSVVAATKPDGLLEQWIQEQPDISISDLIMKILKFKCDHS